MKKRKWGIMCGIGFVLLACGVTALGAVAKHEPSFYRQNQPPSSEASRELAFSFVRHFGEMLAKRKQETWACDTTEAELNCFFNEIFVERGEAEELRKLGISSPIVMLEDNRVRLAFRYGSGFFSTIISYDMKVWLVPREANVIAIEIERARAGALPISKQSILNQLADFARKQNFKVKMFRHEGNAVALIDLQGDQPQAKSILTTLKIGPGTLKIRGKTLEHAIQPVDLKDVKVAAPLP
ncbi:MAG: hypothetical protein HY289_08685 [Planctomycetes bacterium]|nr:hypothetical protein [Planctomycetota bacterium]